MIRIISTLVIAIVFFQSVTGTAFVKIEPQYSEGDYLYVRDPNDNTKKLFQFKIKVKERTISKRDGNLVFAIRLKDIKEVDENVELNSVEFETDTQKTTIVKNETQINRTNNITIVVPGYVLKNSSFEYSTTQVRVKINQMDHYIDPLIFKITPALSIDIPEDERKAKLGKITYEDGMIKSSNTHIFQVNYNCLTQAKLYISSEHNFRMKHKKHDEYIPYVLKIDGTVIRKATDIDVISNHNGFTNQIIGECEVNAQAPHIPLAGKYKDIVTFTLSAL